MKPSLEAVVVTVLGVAVTIAVALVIIPALVHLFGSISSALG